MSHDQNNHPNAPEPKGQAAAPGAPTAPAEAHREPLPEPVECVECRTLIPPDEALVPEGLDYVTYFCSPGCHEAWRRARADERADEQAQTGHQD